MPCKAAERKPPAPPVTPQEFAAHGPDRRAGPRCVSGARVVRQLLVGRRGFTALASVAGVTAAGLLAAVMRQKREAELAGVRSIAEVAQRVLLRPVPRSAGHLRVAVSYTSAVAEARIGGDLYEVVASPDGVRVIVGDVQGKGLEAVETAALVLGAFREAAHNEPDLQRVGARIERAVDRELQGEVRHRCAGRGERRPKRHPAQLRPPRACGRTPRRRGPLRRTTPQYTAPRPRHPRQRRTATVRQISPPAISCCSIPTASRRPGTAGIASAPSASESASQGPRPRDSSSDAAPRPRPARRRTAPR